MGEAQEHEVRDFHHLPPRVKPEEMVEMVEIEELNDTGSPAGDPDQQWLLRGTV